MKITKDTYVFEALRMNPNSKEILEKNKMGSILCFVSQLDTLEEAADRHGIDLSKLLKLLNEGI
ncbi:hybrid cluster protein-associated redox disulfide domain-containing protein [Caminicella sporogenes DSM 14501]|uniref:Hybrid cluster protein-associated redox disulfide domain-containing protein n=1 Tax=Caminicella sporogenes DSM 14501 TaxID=1121266 RepID=A0A1M6SLV8_9FIRM|nr:DUF1858 domain-containing protein [Caminicella sporogenes]RKD26540.1 hypothetical protein BET04_10455 [Caminicella sporogenes]WIF95371.1 DUF1858 domain-containing protein [Caminicella sporogenes]SHK45774.1 hybrid cluster protein-associated redox disulfide domain-containing protein [Caminicella sporogenes DSM 14501]